MKSRAAACRAASVLAVLLASIWPAHARAEIDCGQAAAPEMSEAAQAILSINQGLLGTPPTPRLAGAPAATDRDTATVSLQQRAQLVRQLMATHPEEVRSVMLPEAVVNRLIATDPHNLDLLEHEAAVAGDLAAVQVDDFEHNAGERVVVLHDPTTGAQVAVHASASLRLGALVHRRVTVAGIQLGSDLAAELITPVSPAEFQPALRRSAALQAEAVPASNTTLTCSTTGTQKTAVLLLQFPNNTPAFPGSYGTAAWWQQAIAGSGNSVNSLWSEMTSGGTSDTVDVYGPLTLPQTYGCADYLAMRSAALTLASNTIDLSRYTRIVLGFPASSCAYGGLADIGCNSGDTIVPHPYSVVWMPIVTSYTSRTGVWASLAHELGHNLGLNHANTLDFGAISLGPIDFQATNPGVVGGSSATTATGAITAVDTEYGDRFSVMGNPWSTGPGPYSAEHRADLLGWIPSNGSYSALGTVTTAGSFTIEPASAPSSGSTSLRALRILRDPASSSWMWLEYRDGGTPFDAANLAAVPGQNASSGAVVHYQNGYGDHGKTYQIDMTPTGPGNNFADGALTPGVRWSDPYSPLSLTVNSITSAGLSVSVQYDSNCATFSAPTGPIAAAGDSGTVAVTAPSTCTWRASSNAAWMTLSGTTSGSGNGSFTWTAAPNTGMGQRSTYFSVGRGSARVLQLGNGANVVALSPANPSVEPGSSIALSLTLQDSSGVADLGTVELDATAAGAPTCTVAADLSSGQPQFFLLDPTTEAYTAGIAAGSGTLSTSGCTLSGNGSGLDVNGSTYTLTLNLSFPTAGLRSLFASTTYGAELPLGLLNVGTVSAPPSTPIVTQPPSSARSTATLLTSLPASALPGTPLSLAATVSFSGGSPAPTGLVTFFDRGTALGSAVVNGTGSTAPFLVTLAAGSHSITAVYGGDANFTGSTSAAAVVSLAQAATTATLSTSATAVAAGGAVSLTVVVGHGQVAVTATGTVTLREGATTLAALPLTGGSATFSVAGVSAGTHNYTVAYSGDTAYLPTVSNAVTVSATRSVATLAVSGPATLLAGATAQLSISVSAANATPTGTVLLQEGGNTLASVALSSGNATVTVPALPGGAHTLTATYSGDANLASASVIVPLSILDFTLVASGTGGITVAAGASTGNTAALVLTPGSAGLPLSVTLTCSGAPAGATCTVSPAAATPGSSAVPVTVTVTTTAHSTSEFRAAGAAVLTLPMLALVRRRREHLVLNLLAVLLFFVATSVLASCGTGISGTGASPLSSTPPTSTGTPAGVTTLTVQAVANANGATLSRSATLTLQVN
ncbi:Ig-like domain repeat protein [Terriglobus aquaticus]|uniref:Ig-like domain repeat protein n=2 Tax=Terriglobus aquaticus TaxID=940139 RepID=A0ABW9KIW0_9BACT